MASIIHVLITIFLILLSFFGIYSQKAPSISPPVVEPATRFIVYGDSGTGDAQQIKLASVMELYPVDLLLHTGDIAYDSGTDEELTRNFFTIYASFLKTTPFYPSPGNHDYITDNLNPYLKRFGKDRYYAFDSGRIHFVSLDTNTSLYTDDMTDWLKKNLAAAKHDGWTIVYFHHPPFSSGKEHGSNLTVQKKLVPILESYHVDLVFSGHEHNYERTTPIHGVLYIVTGGGSGNLYDFGPLENFTAFRTVQTHFVYITATRCTLEGKAINLTNQIIDTFHLNRCS